MKKFFVVLSFVVGVHVLHAQDCKTNLYMTANAKIEMTIYDKKGEPNGKQTKVITSVKKNGSEYESTVTHSMEDKKGKVISTGTGTYKCSGGMLSADMKLFMPQEQLEKMGEADAKVEPVYLEYPNTITVGQSLKDAEFKMDLTMKGGGITTSMTFKEENRKVTAKESVTSTAGTWEAYVITYDGSMKTKMGGIGLPGLNFSAKEWYVPGMGTVKSESYTKGGKLSGSTLITAITK